MEFPELRAKYQRIRDELPERVKVIAVTKGFDESAITAATAVGVADIGENYAQEAAAKFNAIGKASARWHFIGQLQRNKVKLLAPFVDVWQTVDSEGLVDEIAKRAPAATILIQVNLTDDPQRGGCSWHDTAALVERARAEDLAVSGLMGVAPNGGEAEARTAFRRLASKATELGLYEVSMGMSADWRIAVEEGATMVRLGSTLFGNRPLATRKPR